MYHLFFKISIIYNINVTKNISIPEFIIKLCPYILLSTTPETNLTITNCNSIINGEYNKENKIKITILT